MAGEDAWWAAAADRWTVSALLSGATWDAVVRGRHDTDCAEPTVPVPSSEGNTTETRAS